jgi:hypothetical protein
VDKNKIPYGAYCYGRGGRNDKCPYWEFVGVKKIYENSKENCEFYSICDNNEKCGTSLGTTCEASVIRCNYLDLLDETEETLLWDQVKECGINEPE